MKIFALLACTLVAVQGLSIKALLRNHEHNLDVLRDWVEGKDDAAIDVGVAEMWTGFDQDFDGVLDTEEAMIVYEQIFGTFDQEAFDHLMGDVDADEDGNITM